MRNVLCHKKMIPGGGFCETFIALALKDCASLLEKNMLEMEEAGEGDEELEIKLSEGCVLLKKVGLLFEDLGELVAFVVVFA